MLIARQAAATTVATTRRAGAQAATFGTTINTLTRSTATSAPVYATPVSIASVATSQAVVVVSSSAVTSVVVTPTTVSLISQQYANSLIVTLDVSAPPNTHNVYRSVYYFLDTIVLYRLVHLHPCTDGRNRDHSDSNAVIYCICKPGPIDQYQGGCCDLVIPLIPHVDWQYGRGHLWGDRRFTISRLDERLALPQVRFAIGFYSISMVQTR